MNDKQRTFLINEVNKNYEEQIEKLIKPKKPSLNNYLVASCLDDSIEFVPIEELRKNIRERVLRLGNNDLFIKERDDYQQEINY